MASIPLYKLDLSFLGKSQDHRPQRGSYRWSSIAQRFVSHQEWRELHATACRASELSRPTVIGTMPPIKSPIDGRIYDGKAEYYRHVERNNCAIVGFDKNWTDHVETGRRYDEKKHEIDVVGDVKKSIEQLSSGTAEPIGHAS